MPIKQQPVVIIAIITAICLIGDSMLYVVLPTHWQEAGLGSLWEVGVILSINRFVRLPLGPLAGWLYRHISHKTGMVIAIVLAVISTISYGIVEGFIGWILIRILWGMAWTLLRMGAFLTIVDLSDEQNRGTLMGKYNGIFRLGSLIGMLGGGLLADAYGLSAVAIGFGIIPAIALPFFMVYISGSLANKPAPLVQSIANAQQKFFSYKELLQGSPIVVLLLKGLLITMIFEGMFTATLTHLVDARDISGVSLFGISLGAAAISGILQSMRWIWGPWLAPWVGRRTDERNNRPFVLTVMSFTSALFFFILPLPVPILVWMLLIAGIFACSTVLTTVMDALAAESAAKRSKVVVITAYTIAIDLGAALGPLIGYTLEAHFNEQVMLWTAALILLILPRFKSGIENKA